MTKFVAEVESLKVKVELDFAKIETLNKMIEQIQRTYDTAIDTAFSMEDRQFNRYNALCQKQEGTFRKFTKEEVKAYTKDDYNWPCVSESYTTDDGIRAERNSFAQIMIDEMVKVDMHKSTMKIVINEKLAVEKSYVEAL